jgi:hypothetical protein
MLSRLTVASFLLVLLWRTPVIAQDHDYLQHGEERLTADYEIKYSRAVRYVLARGWRKDVVLRIVNIPPFQPESVIGIARTSTGYQAFKVTAGKHIWSELGFGSGDSKRRQADYRSIKPLVDERGMSDPLAARVAAIWRRVLIDSRNYGKDPSIYLDSDHFSFYLAFAPRERVAAYMTGWGPHTSQLMHVAGAIASRANGAPEAYVAREIAKAEKALGM